MSSGLELSSQGQTKDEAAILSSLQNSNSAGSAPSSPVVPALTTSTINTPFSDSKVARVIKKMKTQSAPSPFNRIGHIIFKRCPSLLPALVQLFNICWAQSTIPVVWKCVAIKLTPKSSATEDPANPANFRPIALTPCIGKLFTTLLRNCWLRYMVANHYLDPSLQKAFAFMRTVPGCTENNLKLSSIMAEAHSDHKSVAVCWLVLANAYGSINHALINFSLCHYHSPPQFLAAVQALYTGLNAKVITADWEPPVISIQKGVYQGDPLSVVIFNTVMNMLLDTISLRSDLGYQFSNSCRQVNTLQFADDTCLVGNADAVSCNIPSITTLPTDIGDSYMFLLHIVTMDLRPDII